MQSTSESSCYHCGLPLPAKPLYALLDRVQRPVCCTGCQAVALAIAGEGLSGYYRTRTEFAKRGDVAHAEDGLEVYDDPQLQAGFTRSTGQHEREALLILEGIVCSACIWLNEQHLSRLPGVLEAQVNYATRRARVRWDSRVVKLSAILRAVAEIGYRAWPATSMAVDEARRRETRTAIWRLFVAGFSMMQVMMYALPAYLPDADTMGDDLRMLMRLASLALTLPVLMYSCTPFWRGAWRDMQRMRPGMDVPIALGIGVAFVASVWATFTGGADVYYDSISMFVFFLLSARFLEMRARQKAAANLEHLDKALPAVAHRLPAFPDLRAEEVPALALRRGDLVLVRPGESFPVDGVVVQGESDCDESLLTGESRPVSRSVGGEVIAGAFNRASPLVVRVERIAEDTRASGIRRLVERAASQRPALVELTDRIAGWLVSAVVLAALGTFAFWVHRDPAHAVWIAVSVLVVTCPCALSLATPAALTVGVGRLARRGVIVTRAQAIEALSKVTHVVFDKTGTLTEGRLSLVRSVPLSDRSSEPCRAIAAALERGSEHPIAAALIASSDESAEPMVWQLRNVPGAGIEGVVDGARTRIGTSAFVAALTGTAPPETQHSSEAYTQVWLGREGEWLACFEFSDRLRSEAPEIVRNLRVDGRQVMILSGDGEPAVREAAARLNIPQYEAGLTPEAKHARVQALQEQGAVVAMVGDGVNDAPVLAQAHVSIAMGSGALLSQAHSDIVLLSGLGNMLDAFRIARSTWRVVRQNLAWALAYNLVAIPAAAAGWVSPWLAGLGMGASSLVVVVNALRLLREEAREQVPDAAAAVPPASELRAM